MILRMLILMFFAAMAVFSQGPPIEPGVSKALAEWRAVNYSNISYRLNLTLEKMSPVLKGSIEIHVTQAAYACAQPNCPPLSIILDWRKIAGHEKDSTISNVTVNGKPMEVRGGGAFPVDLTTKPYIIEDREHLIIGDGVKMGENVIKLDFTSPILTSGSAITRYVDKEDGAEYIYSLFVPSDASTAFPVFDQPDLKARFQLRLSVPDDWNAISNTILVSGIGGAHREEFSFDETKPISTYVFAFAAGPLEAFGDIGGNPSGSEGAPSNSARSVATGTLPTGRVSAYYLSSHIYVRKSQAAKFKPNAAEVFRLTHEAVKYLETYFDYKFPFPKYDLVLIPEFPFGGMEHAGATFLRESSVIFPSEPTKSDYISRATLIFHETAHQWFGDTVTMKWFDDLWLKEGFANFMAYKALEKIMPEANAWKVFYERIKQPAYATDSTRGTTAIYQPIDNLSAAKSAYGNIVYNKAPAFLRQAEFYLGEDKFQTAVHAFLKKHEFANADWQDLVNEFQWANGKNLATWATGWVKRPGLFMSKFSYGKNGEPLINNGEPIGAFTERHSIETDAYQERKYRFLVIYPNGTREVSDFQPYTDIRKTSFQMTRTDYLVFLKGEPLLVFPNYGDYDYGIFLLDDKSRDYILKNIQNEKDPFLRSMMWGSLWDSVREGELDPREYVELVIKQLGGEALQKPARSRGAAGPSTTSSAAKNVAATSAGAVADRGTLESDETIIQSLLGRVSTALNYYIPAPDTALADARASASGDLRSRLEDVVLDRMQNAPTLGQRITFYRAFLNIASTERSRKILSEILNLKFHIPDLKLKTKDRFDIVTRLAVLGDPAAPKLLADLEKTETGDDAKRYAYAAHAAFATKENRDKFWNDFVGNKDISESWIESAIGPFNSIRHDDLSLPYLQRALAELPNLKRTRKIFFVNGWLGAFIGGQRSQQALDIVNKFLADNQGLDKDLRLKILENVDTIERAVKIRAKKW